MGVPDFAYAGEVALGRALCDPTGELSDLKDAAATYPPQLAEAVVARLGEATFLIGGARKGAAAHGLFARLDTTAGQNNWQLLHRGALLRSVQTKAPFGDDIVAAALREGWSVSPEDLTYAPVGYGSWHWHARSAAHGKLFVTVDEVATEAEALTKTNPVLSELEWAYGVPLRLVDAGMSFARPPVPTMAGRILFTLDERWVISVWPMIDGRATHDGTYSSRDDASAVLKVAGVLHALPPGMFARTAPRSENFRLPGTDRLLELVDHTWPGPHVGPHAAAAERLLHRHAEHIHGVARLYDELVDQAPPAEEWVVTHGEPHAANVVFTDEAAVLIDWDTAKVAPRERDLWMIAADGFDIGDADQSMLRLYRAQWDLRELSDYARRFADPSDDGPEGEPAWEDFTEYVDRSAHI